MVALGNAGNQAVCDNDGYSYLYIIVLGFSSVLTFVLLMLFATLVYAIEAAYQETAR
jgi:hypothetical protein